MPTYVSQGTINVHFRTNNNDVRQTLHFVPGNDYSIKHRAKNFAVFVSSQDSDAFVREYDQVKIIEIILTVNWQADVSQMTLSNFALHQTKVEIEVTRGLTLRGITVPKHAR